MAFQAAVLAVSFFPGLVWLLFFEEEDDHPEPKRLVAAVFIIGMISAIAVLLIGGILKTIIFGQGTTYALSYLTMAAFLEEMGKFIFVFLFVRHMKAFDEPVDAMIYMVVGALGFATLENIAYLSREASNIPSLSPAIQTAPWSYIGQIASLRFVGSTLLHALSSAIIGYFWALNVRHFNKTHFLLIGIPLATGLHLYFNYLIVTYGSMTYILPLLLVAGFFVLSDFEELKWRTV